MRTYIDFGAVLTWNGMTIPKDPKNADYREALAMVDAETAEIVAYEKPSPTDADRASAKQAIDDAAERCRLLWITGGAGQAMVYQEKRAEAVRFVAEGGEPEDFPILSASVGIEGEDLAAVAAVVLGTAAAWTALAASIEGLRLSAKRSAGLAGTWAEIDASQAVDWPTP